MFNSIADFRNQAVAAIAALVVSAVFVSAAIGPVVPLA